MRTMPTTSTLSCKQADRWRLVSGADDKCVKIWDLHNGQRLVTLKYHTAGVTCIQFSDTMLVSGSFDGTVKLLDFSAV